MRSQIIRMGAAYCWAVYDGPKVVAHGISLSRAGAEQEIAAIKGEQR